MEDKKQELVDFFRKKAQERRDRASALENEARKLLEQAEALDERATDLLLNDLKIPVA